MDPERVILHSGFFVRTILCLKPGAHEALPPLKITVAGTKPGLEQEVHAADSRNLYGPDFGFELAGFARSGRWRSCNC